MKSVALSSAGLVLATAASVANVGFDVAAKRALSGRNFLYTTLKIRTVVALLLSLVLVGLWLYAPTRSSVALFRLGFSGLLHSGVMLVLLLSTGLVTVSILLYYRSLQIAPLSVTAPLFGLTPVFLLITGYILFRHLPSVRVIVGVVCILAGSLQAHWRPTMRSPFLAAASFLREKGVRAMLGACILLSITNLLDQWLVKRLDVLSYAWLYVVLCAAFTGFMALIVRPSGTSTPLATRWIILAGLLDTTMLLLQFASLLYIDAVVTIAIKRSGMVLSVVAGSLFFSEQHGRQRLAASCVVLIGVLMMYFDMRTWAIVLSIVAAAACTMLAAKMARPDDIQEPDLEPSVL